MRVKNSSARIFKKGTGPGKQINLFGAHTSKIYRQVIRLHVNFLLEAPAGATFSEATLMLLESISSAGIPSQLLGNIFDLKSGNRKLGNTLGEPSKTVLVLSFTGIRDVSTFHGNKNAPGR